MQKVQNKNAVFKGLAFPIGYTLFMNVFQSIAMLLVIVLAIAPIIFSLIAMPELGELDLVTLIMESYTTALDSNVWFLSVLTTIAALLILWFVFNRKNHDFKEYFHFTKAPVRAIATAALLGLSWFFFVNGLLGALQELIFWLIEELLAYMEEVALMDISPFVDLYHQILDALDQTNDDTGMFIVAAIFGAPLIEELVFRAGPLTHLTKKMSAFWAIMLTSALFALAHVNPVQMIYTFVLGLFAGYLFVKTDSIYPSIVCHFVFNGANLIRMTLQSLFNPEFLAGNPLYPQLSETMEIWSDVTFWIYIAITFLIAIPMLAVGIIMLIKLRRPEKAAAAAAQPTEPTLCDGAYVIAATEDTDAPEEPETPDNSENSENSDPPEEPEITDEAAQSEARA
ncbi:MAG: CPBP family intramembrane metalloprotease [Clostridia bacterium]|nr:CPBP family intramembrane metalloprotease [Clostridia bacterium]